MSTEQSGGGREAPKKKFLTPRTCVSMGVGWLVGISWSASHGGSWSSAFMLAPVSLFFFVLAYRRRERKPDGRPVTCAICGKEGRYYRDGPMPDGMAHTLCILKVNAEKAAAKEAEEKRLKAEAEQRAADDRQVALVKRALAEFAAEKGAQP